MRRKTGNKQKYFYFLKKKKRKKRTYFVYFHTLAYNEIPQSLGYLCINQQKKEERKYW